MISTFSLAGALYLVGIGIVLILKPSYMFTPDGDWKEFGIGQREDRYTPFPFWIFCIMWALTAYFIVLMLEPYLTESKVVALTPIGSAAAAANASSNIVYNSRNIRNRRSVSSSESDSAIELPKGYYVLNKKATRLSGVPKYVYMGPNEPAD
jgi:hypothetical protein